MGGGYDDDDAARAAAFASSPSDYGGDDDGGGTPTREDDFGGGSPPPGASTPVGGGGGTPTGSPGAGGEGGTPPPEDDAGGGGDEEGKRVGDWVAYTDEEGNTYYHNLVTDETTWDAPPGFEEDGAEDGEGAGEGGASTPPPSSPAGEGGDGTPLPASPVGEGGGTPSPPSSPVGEYGGGTPPLPASPVGGGGTPPPSSPPFGEGGGTPPPSSPVGGGGTPPPSSPVGEGGGTPPPSSPVGEEGGGEGDGSNKWVVYKDDEGREYYYNETTGETAWELPEGAEVVEPAEEEGAAEGEEHATVEGKEAAGVDTMEVDQEEAAVEEQEEEKKEPERDPLEVALENAEGALKETDAILEPGCLANVGELVRGLGGSEGGKKAMQSLVNSYQGQTAACGLLGLWLTELKAANASGKSSTSAAAAAAPGKDAGAGGGAISRAEALAVVSKRDPREAAADDVRSLAEDVVHKLARERFNTQKGDEILNLSKAEAAFLEEMIESDRWRRLLIDLSAAHKDSAVLMYCLQTISKRGHHREIARRINQSDYFGVFNSMLASELTFLGKMAVGGDGSEGGGEDGDGDGDRIGVDVVVADLRRTCTSTSYTYLYASEVLSELRSRALSKKFADPSRAAAVRRAARKWERLAEELEEEMLSAAAAGAKNPLARKRRVDVCLTVGDLFQRKRRRAVPDEEEEDAGDGGRRNRGMPSMRDQLDDAVVGLLRKHALGMDVDRALLDQVLRGSYGGRADKERIGDALIAHPTAISALLGGMYRPGASRIRSLEIRHKCAKLVSLAASAAGRAARRDAPGGEGAAEEEEEEDGEEGREKADLAEDKLTKALLRASQLCEQVENMVAFTVVDELIKDDSAPTSSVSPGRQLSSLCVRHAPVARGALLWAAELGSKADFAQSAAYPTLAPSVLSLARIAAVHHPLVRPAALDLTFAFLKHSPPDLSYQKMSALKEQGLRLLVWLTALGQAISVFDTLTEKLKKAGTTNCGIDSANLRYFVAGVLEVMRPPMSVPLVRSMGAFLSNKTCVDALQSSYFEKSKKKALAELVWNFDKAVTAGREALRSSLDDVALVSSLRAVYAR